MSDKNMNEIIESIKSLEEKDLGKLFNTDQFIELEHYFINQGLLDRTMPVYKLIDQIEGLYIKGTLEEIRYSIFGAIIIVVYNYGYDRRCDGIGTMQLFIKYNNVDILNDIKPGDGVIVSPDYDLGNNLGYNYIAKDITKMERMFHPLNICPKCRTIYPSDLKNGVCGKCNAPGEEETPLTLITTTDELYKILDDM